jgi:hypothetical protein
VHVCASNRAAFRDQIFQLFDDTFNGGSKFRGKADTCVPDHNIRHGATARDLFDIARRINRERNMAVRCEDGMHVFLECDVDFARGLQTDFYDLLVAVDSAKSPRWCLATICLDETRRQQLHAVAAFSSLDASGPVLAQNSWGLSRPIIEITKANFMHHFCINPTLVSCVAKQISIDCSQFVRLSALRSCPIADQTQRWCCVCSCDCHTAADCTCFVFRYF